MCETQQVDLLFSLYLLSCVELNIEISAQQDGHVSTAEIFSYFAQTSESKSVKRELLKPDRSEKAIFPALFGPIGV